MTKILILSEFSNKISIFAGQQCKNNYYMATNVKTKVSNKEDVKANAATPKIKKRGLVGVWKGKIKIIGDIDNVFNMVF